MSRPYTAIPSKKSLTASQSLASLKGQNQHIKVQDYSDVMAMQINIPESMEEDNCGYDFKRNNN